MANVKVKKSPKKPSDVKKHYDQAPTVVPSNGIVFRVKVKKK